MTIFLIISWWDGKLFLYYPMMINSPLASQALSHHSASQWTIIDTHSIPGEIIFKSSLLLFLCDIYPLYETFFHHLLVGVQCQCPGTVTKMDPMQLAPWFWGFVKKLSFIESERNYTLHYDAPGFSFAPKIIWHICMNCTLIKRYKLW